MEQKLGSLLSQQKEGLIQWRDQFKDNVSKFIKDELHERLREYEQAFQDIAKCQVVLQVKHLEQEQRERFQRLEDDLKQVERYEQR